jgi:hypothetical protein
LTKKKKTMILISCLLLIFILGIGGKKYMDSKRFHEEMLTIVKSDEAKKVIEEGLRNLDPDALTSEGIIKSYEVDEESVKHNPMGGIDGVIFINSDKNLDILFNLDKNKDNGFSSKYVISGYSNDLKEELKKERENDFYR